MSNYPPGTPGPRHTLGEVTCGHCGETSPVQSTTDLGMTDWNPAECPVCEQPWPADAELEPDSGPDPDELRDRQLDAEAADYERRYEL
jgi:hypothetical protein